MSISLAVRYRPKSFSELTEQTYISDILTHQLETNTIQHCYLFTGPAGTGKTTSARIFANAINHGQGNPIEMDAASHNSVEDIRSISVQAKQKSIDSEYKIYIIDECHALSSSAWQAMLKLIEEPPEKTIFILCTTNPEKIPNTILSRVQRYDFNKISSEGIFSRLEQVLKFEGINTYEKDSLVYISKLAEGGMRDALTMLDKCLSYSSDLTVNKVTDALGIVGYDYMFSFLQKVSNSDEGGIIDSIEHLYNSGKDLKQFIRNFMDFVIDIRKYKITNNFNFIRIPETYKESLKSAPSDIVGLLNSLVKLSNTIKYDAQPRSTIEAHFILFMNGGE